MLSDSSQKIIQEEIVDMLPRIEKIKKAARSGGPNEELFIKTRCEQVTKLLQEIESKA